MPTVQDLVDDARIRHFTFGQVQIPDGAILRFINERVRATLLRAAAVVEPILNESKELATIVDEYLVVVTDDGVPYTDNTSAAGFPMAFDGSTPYIDDSYPIARDPFGSYGDIIGLPLPDDLVRVTNVIATRRDGRHERVGLEEERARHEKGRTKQLRMFINGARLIPVRQPTDETSEWNDVTAIAISYLTWSDRTALTDELTIHAAIYRALVAQVAEWLALATPGVTDAVRKHLAVQRQEAEAALDVDANAVLEDAVSNRVLFRR